MGKNKIILTTLLPKTHRTSEENLGIAYLKSSLMNKGYNVEIIDAWLNELSVDYVFDKIIKEMDDILFVGISSYMSNTASTVSLIQKIKEYNSNIKIVCGGFGPTFYPKEYLLSGSDYVLLGEGEESICDLAYAIENNISLEDVKNLGYKKNGNVVINELRCLVNDLDEFPFPSRDTLDTVMKNKSSVNMITARGCSGNCEFCSVISFFRLSDGKIWRTRSIKNIVDEIEQLVNKGVKYIKMVDDSFIDGNRDENWCRNFADEIQKRHINVKLRGQIRADKVTEGILFHLKRAGFFSFACGIENGSQTALSRMNKRATLEDNKRALELFKKYDYIVQMGYILFDQKTTFKELEENYEFMRKYEFAVTKGIFSEMFSAEGTKLNARLRENNELTESDFISNNNKYSLKDKMVQKIYTALKMWHKSHSVIYDMTIDPLIAPKAINEDEQKEFYQCIMNLKKMDLMIYKEILLLVKSNPHVNIVDIVEQRIKNTEFEYKEIYTKVRKLYKKSKLEYNAQVNPFI